METLIRRSVLERDGVDYGADARVRFTMPNGVVLEVYRANRADPEGTLTIRALNGSIALIPRADNTVCVMSRCEDTEQWK